MLIMLPEFKPASATNVMHAFSDKLLGITTSERQSVTYEQEQLDAIRRSNQQPAPKRV